ncbi:hypothetical protein H2248_006536 [Termitomyces sp. 'cryptogamus']|nr:hypothetical protein H2248_006536 [Termitomyces sp. 'cryptogamus']
MPITTTSAAVHIAPVVIKTFFEHGKRKAKEIKEGRAGQDAKDDIFYDEAFHIVKAFIQLGTENTVESLQAFTNTHVPAPPWAAVSPVLIPLSSCNRAADILIEWFGPHDLKHVVGGERWWQVRGLDGLDGEWMTEKDYLSSSTEHKEHGRIKLSNDDCNILRMNHLETVMLYVHGGGYFWGSINTHRYQIIRYARKFKGRAFAVNYRKAPQYPWPCPIQDILAAYFYLIEPPRGALHKAVSPSKIVMAGDSAGGGLCLTVLTILRDLGLPMPAGAVLISPWVDLTHSFPSVMDNSDTDIIPQYGFLAKPSALWPLYPLPKDSGHVISTRSNVPLKPGHADTLKPTPGRIHDVDNTDDDVISGERVQAQKQMLSESLKEDASSAEGKGSKTEVKEYVLDYDINFWEPKPPKVLMEGSIELRAQIQLYATNEQLGHPLVSPILQGSLGNLPPLYILAGNDEVLRDEIIYLAHRAAHPSEYPLRHGVMQDGHRQKENAERFTNPTKVHLQVFDGMCHVLTVFTFTKSAKRAYRSIAEFVKHVSFRDTEHLEHVPERHRSPSDTHTEDLNEPQHRPFSEKRQQFFHFLNTKKPSQDPIDVSLYKRNGANAANEVKHDEVNFVPVSHLANEGNSDDPIRNATNDISNLSMIRERVDIRGITRHMEPPKEIKALQIRPEKVGIIKEGPIRRWFEGQQKWDTRFEHAAKRAIKRRTKIEASASVMLDNARVQGLLVGGPPPLRQSSLPEHKTHGIQDDRRWGPLDLDDERPPPSAIAKRRDTTEALALLKKTIYHTAPVTHKTVPNMRMSDTICAALNPRDNPNKPPQQSVSEQQVRARLIPVHGLRLWDSIIRYFGKETLKKQKAKEDTSS